MVRFIRDEDGSTAVEYELMGAFLGCCILLALSSVGSSTNETMNAIATALKGGNNDTAAVAPSAAMTAGGSPMASPPSIGSGSP